MEIIRTQMKTPLYMLARFSCKSGTLMSKSDLWQVPSAGKRCVPAACACKQVNKICVYTLLKKVVWQYFPTKSKHLTDQIQTLNCKAWMPCMYPVSYGSSSHDKLNLHGTTYFSCQMLKPRYPHLCSSSIHFSLHIGLCIILRDSGTSTAW